MDADAERVRAALAATHWTGVGNSPFGRNQRDAVAALDALVAERDAANERADQVLVAWYLADPQLCAHYCDQTLDKSGALLGHVRDLARAALKGSA